MQQRNDKNPVKPGDLIIEDAFREKSINLFFFFNFRRYARACVRIWSLRPLVQYLNLSYLFYLSPYIELYRNITSAPAFPCICCLYYRHNAFLKDVRAKIF